MADIYAALNGKRSFPDLFFCVFICMIIRRIIPCPAGKYEQCDKKKTGIPHTVSYLMHPSKNISETEYSK
jgi:hypothetical protein